MSLKKRNVPFLKKCNFKNTLFDMHEDELGFQSTDKYNSTIAYLARKFKSLQKIRSVMLIFSAFLADAPPRFSLPARVRLLEDDHLRLPSNHTLWYYY